MLLAEGDIKRLLVCVPPRSLKSLLCSVIYPAWLLARKESERVLCVSYAQPLADDFGRQCRQLVESSFFTGTFSTRLSADRRAVEQFETVSGGARISTSVHGTVLGRGGDFIILDDIMKAEDAMSDTGRKRVMDWVRETLVSRPNSKADARMLLIMQRLHEEDPAGHMLAQGGWETVILPALATEPEEHHYRVAGRPTVFRREPGEPLHPARESAETLERVRREMGSLTFEAQYQQNPLPAEGHIIRRSWFGDYDAAGLPPFERIMQSVDTGSKTAASHDYSVIMTMGQREGKLFLVDIWRGKLEMPDLCRKVVEQYERYRPERVIIEDKGSGIALIQALRAQWFFEIVPYTPHRDKVTRLHAVAPAVESGVVFLPRLAVWRDAFLHEICGFPATRHDDQVDAFSQMVSWFQGQGNPGGIFEFIRQEAESKRAFNEDAVVPVRVPGNSSHLYLGDGTRVMVPASRVIQVTEAQFAGLRRSGCTRLDSKS